MDEQRARALSLLAASFGLAWVSITLIAAPGPAAWVALTGDPADAGVFFALFSVSGALGAAIGGRAMDRFGRRETLIAAHALAAAGYTGAGVAFAAGSLLAFGAAAAAISFATGIIALTRLPAGEMFGPGERARAVARVQVAATFGAIAGPLLLVLSGPLAARLGRAPEGIVWFLAPPLFLAAAILVARSPDTRALAPAPVPGAAATPSRIPALPFLAGAVALVCAQAAMVSVMGVAGVDLRHAGHGAGTTGIVMALHFVGMFGLSLVVGRVADRAGRRNTILAGIAILAAGGLVSAFVAGAAGLGLGLLLIGLGWSFSYIGGTVVLTDVVPAARRARVLGLVDFTIAIGAAAASWTGGRWYAARGLTGLGLAAVAIVAVPLVVAALLREASPGRYGSTPPS